MGAIAVETLMAALYTNHALHMAFMSDPHPILDRYDLTEDERASLLLTDKPGLVLAGNSFAYKRWKANQWRHKKAYTFAAPNAERIESVEDIALVQQRCSEERYRGG